VSTAFFSAFLATTAHWKIQSTSVAKFIQRYVLVFEHTITHHRRRQEIIKALSHAPDDAYPDAFATIWWASHAARAAWA
jgi:hypothetical protein